MRKHPSTTALGRAIDAWCTENERTPAYVARKVGVSNECLSEWRLYGTWPYPKHLAPLSSLLGMSVSALLSLREVDTEVVRERRMMTNRAAVAVRGGGR